jgi:SpoVK/Ycf46/Vps4 family AAA+-type ATPase
MTVQDPRKEIALLVNSQFPIIYLDTWEERRATEILGLVAEDLNLPLYVWTVTQGLARAGGAPIYNTQEPAQVLAQIGGIEMEAIFLLKDFHKYLEQDVIVRTLRDLSAKFKRARHAMVISAPVVNIPVELERECARFALGLPTESELSQQADLTVKDLCQERRILTQFTPDIFPVVARALLGLTRAEARRVLTESILENSRFDSSTLDLIRRNKGKLIKGQGVLEFLEPGGCMSSVGGLARLKAWLEKRRAAFSMEAERFGLDPPKGILILGVQGCGKSLCAKAVACEWKLQLLKFDASTLYEKYIGESEKNLRRSLQVAEVVAPSVLWIDELEKMFPASGLRSESDGGLSVRVFGTFLNWMQEKKAPVFVAATSNDISALPPELLRKGRFDEIFFVDLPNAEERETIFAIHLSRHKQDSAKFDMAQLAAASEGFSGAEIEQAVTSGLYSAFAQKCALSTDLLVKEIASTFPLSVTMREKVESLRQWAHERAVPAN